MEWNFRRVPLEKVYSLNARKGWLRLYQNPEVISMRGRCSLMGIRQKETDFEYTASMKFSPQQEQSEAGVSLFLQDDNYINFTLINEGGQTVLKLVVKERKKAVEVVAQEVLNAYQDNIIFKINADYKGYQYAYSLDGGGSYTPFAKTASNLILCHGYTGAYCGLYASSNGNETKEHADFDWIFHQGFQK